MLLSPSSGAQTAWDMLHEEQMFPRITTSCADLDDILGGGINCKEVTEIGLLIRCVLCLLVEGFSRLFFISLR